jgi:MFS transporter, DHA1 family, multidrug resistance protein
MSSIFSTATRPVAAQRRVSTKGGLLGVSLYVVGFALGPALWAPSELTGRRLPLVLSMFGLSTFQVAVAAAKDLQTNHHTLPVLGGSFPQL